MAILTVVVQSRDVSYVSTRAGCEAAETAREELPTTLPASHGDDVVRQSSHCHKPTEARTQPTNN